MQHNLERLNLRSLTRGSFFYLTAPISIASVIKWTKALENADDGCIKIIVGVNQTVLSMSQTNSHAATLTEIQVNSQKKSSLFVSWK